MKSLHVVFGSLVLVTACGADAPAPTQPTSAAPPPTPSVAPPAPPVTSVTTKRVVISLSRPSGTNVTTISSDGSVTSALDVLENGRGPHVDATMKLAPDGTLLSFTARGHHTMGTPVEESFTRDGNHVVWKSKEEQGEKDLTETTFFLPFADCPDAGGFLVQALIKAGGTLPLLPAGTAHAEKVADMTVHGKSGDRHINAYDVTGLDLLPQHEWMNDDGTWFGYVSPWFSVLPEGFESAIEPVIAKQTELDRVRDQAVVKQVTDTPPAAGLAFTHARVLDVERGKYLADTTVVVIGDTIKSVGPSTGAKIPTGARVVDLAGKTLIPGLWDMHAHTSDSDGALNIASGVTTVRDVGNDPDKLDDWKKRYDTGAAIGPHMLRFGFIEGRGEKAASSKVTAENEDEAKAGVAEYVRRGYDGIKIYNSMKPELVPVITKEAHAHNMMVTGHIPVHMLANEAVKAGYDGIEHINMLFLNFFADHDTDTRTTTRFTLVGDKAASFDLKSKPMTDFIALLKEHHTVIDPTLDAFEDLLVGVQGRIIPGMEPVVSRLPAVVQRGYLAGGLPLDGDKQATYRASYDKMLALVKLLHDDKVQVVTGTDELAGLMLHHELALFVRAGITPADTLRCATIDAARSMKLDKKSGSISVGKTADFVVVDGDPLARIEDASHVETTVKGGVLFASAPLYASVGVKAYSPPALGN